MRVELRESAFDGGAMLHYPASRRSVCERVYVSTIYAAWYLFLYCPSFWLHIAAHESAQTPNLIDV